MISSLLADNQLFSAGIGLFGLGSGIAIARQSYIKGKQIFLHFFVTSIEITSKDPSYHWILPWITKNCHGYSRKFSLTSQNFSSNELVLSPAPGRHLLRFSGRWIQIIRERQRTMIDLTSGLPFESITLQAFGKGNLIFLQKLLQRAKEESTAGLREQIQIFTPFAHEWRPFGAPKRKRPLESVVLQVNLKEEILQDLNEFISSSNWYHQRGIPWRRGYLLYGPPGTGKSSFIHALASHLDYSIAMLNFSDWHLTDDRLVHLFNNLPEKTILLLEDVDKVFNGNSNGNMHLQSGKVSCSALLNALDGVAASEARIIFMTTNHLERLDEAFIRPGRVDVKWEVGLADSRQASEMFANFFPKEQQFAEEFGRQVGENKISPAEIQGILIAHKKMPSLARL